MKLTLTGYILACFFGAVIATAIKIGIDRNKKPVVTGKVIDKLQTMDMEGNIQLHLMVKNDTSGIVSDVMVVPTMFYGVEIGNGVILHNYKK